MSLKRVLAPAAAMLVAFGWAGAARAQDEVIGIPHDRQLGLQPGVTKLAHDLDFIHNVILTPLIFVIALFVMALLVYVMWKFNAKRHPVPTKVTHNTTIEILWTG